MKIRDYRLAIAYQYAISSYGIREHKGPANNPDVSKFMDTTWYDDNRDSVPWCSAFINWCMEKASLDHTDSPTAKSWLEWGVRTYHPVQGDIVVMNRDGGGHVGFFVSGGRDRIAVLGGNQNDSVSIADYGARQVIEFRTFLEPLHQQYPVYKPPVYLLQDDESVLLAGEPEVTLERVT